MNIEEFRVKTAALLASIAEHIEADVTVALARLDELVTHVVDYHEERLKAESSNTPATEAGTGSNGAEISQPGKAPSGEGETGQGDNAEAIEMAQAAVKAAEDAILNAGVDADQDKLAADLKAAEDALAVLLPAT